MNRNNNELNIEETVENWAKNLNESHNYFLNDPYKSLNMLRKAIDLLEKMNKENLIDESNYLFGYLKTYRSLAEYHIAQQEFDRALEILTDLYKEVNKKINEDYSDDSFLYEYSCLLYDLSIINEKENKVIRALEYGTKALNIAKKLFSREKNLRCISLVIDCYVQEGFINLLLGNIISTGEYLNEALNIIEVAQEKFPNNNWNDIRKKVNIIINKYKIYKDHN